MASTSALWPMIGRAAEQGLIRDSLRDQRTRGVLVQGPPGVGKTRLVEAICEERERDRGTVARVVATREGSGFPLAALAPLLVQGVSDPAAVPRDPVLLLASLRESITSTPGEPLPLMFIDDLPHLDALSAAMIVQLVESRSVVLLATVRTGDPLPEMYQGHWSGDGVVKIDLRPLAESDCARLLARVLGAPVAAKSVGRLYTVSGGLPLHLKELVSTAVADGSLRPVEGVWQLAAREIKNPALSQLLAARIAELAPESADLIRRIAVCQPLELDDFADDVTDRLVELEQAGLVEVDLSASGDWAVRLAHPSYADPIRGATSRLQIRKILLEQIAVVRARDRGLKDVVRLSIWELEATGRGEPSVLMAAARLARHGHEFEVVRRLAAAAVDSDPQPSAESLLLLGESLRELGDGAAAGPVLDRAAEAPGGPEILARVAVARSGLAGHGRNRPDLAAAVLAQARDGIPEEADALSVARAVMLTVWEQTDQALDELARVDPQRSRHPRLAGLYFIGAVGALVSAGRPGEAIALADELMPLLRTEGNLFHDGMPLMLRASALLELQGPARALPDATAALRECLDSGVDRLICYAASQLFAVQLAAGRPRTAARWAREVISVARSAQHRSFLSLGMSNLATAIAVTGDAAGARQVLDALQAVKREYPGPAGPPPSWEIRGQAWTLAARGELSRAASMLQDGAADARDRGQWSVSATLLHDVARLGGAKSVVGPLGEAAGACPSPQVARQHRHASAAAAADPDALAAVAQEWADTGSRLVAAETFLTAATATTRHQGLGRRAGALTARGTDLAAGCQGASTPGLTLVNQVDPLSPREREIAAMASQGLRSRDIAESLVVSIRTVDNHLQAVYTKLGIAGRRELSEALRLPT